MGRKKRRFSDWDTFETYCRSAPERSFQIYCVVREDYPGIVETLSLRSSQSGKRLLLHHEFSCFGLDWMGDLGAHDFYTLADIEALREFVVHTLGCTVEDLSTAFEMPDVFPVTSDKANTERYREGWRRFKRDFDAGSLTLPGLTPSD